MYTEDYGMRHEEDVSEYRKEVSWSPQLRLWDREKGQRVGHPLRLARRGEMRLHPNDFYNVWANFTLKGDQLLLYPRCSSMISFLSQWCTIRSPFLVASGSYKTGILQAVFVAAPDVSIPVIPSFILRFLQRMSCLSSNLLENPSKSPCGTSGLSSNTDKFRDNTEKKRKPSKENCRGVCTWVFKVFEGV